MKQPPLRWIAVTAAAVAAVLCWYLLTREPDATPRTAGKGTAPAALVTGNRFASSPAEPLPKFGTDEFKRALHERGLKWLDSRGRDAAGLVAMWDLTGDESFLTEAAYKFPHGPRVCIAMIGKEAGTVAKAIPWIRQLLNAQSYNPHAWHLMAWALASSNDQARALAALKEAGNSGGPRESFVGARAATVREAALASGISPGDAARVAIGAPLDRMTSCRVYSSINDTILTELKDAQASGDQDRLMEITRLGLAIAQNLTGPGLVTLRDERIGNNLGITLLANLPGDTELTPGGRTVASLRSELNSRRAYLEEAAAAAPMGSILEAFLKTVGDDLMVTYFDTLIKKGEAQALYGALPEWEKALEREAASSGK